MEKIKLSKDDYYLGIAKSVSKKSTCIRRKLGAIIVIDDAIVSTGYNGPARGVINCNEVGCLKDKVNAEQYRGYDYCTAVHAEENAVVNAARNGGKVHGGILYIYGEHADGRPAPSYSCDRCRRILINAGIKKLITDDEQGNRIVYNIDDWAIEDSERYKKQLEEAEKSTSSGQ